MNITEEKDLKDNNIDKILEQLESKMSHILINIDDIKGINAKYLLIESHRSIKLLSYI
jgi:hypothetical protein